MNYEGTERVINYRPELKKIELVKSVNACLLMSRLEELFAARPQGFSKFIKPCASQHELTGLCWLEDLGMGIRQFKNAWEQIGVSYVNVIHPDEVEFKGKLYAMVRWSRGGISNWYGYLRNHVEVEKELRKINGREGHLE